MAITTCFFIQMLHIYSAILRKYAYKYKYYNVQLVLNIKFQKYTLTGSLRTIPGLNSVKIVFINVVMNKSFFGN